MVSAVFLRRQFGPPRSRSATVSHFRQDGSLHQRKTNRYVLEFFGCAVNSVELFWTGSICMNASSQWELYAYVRKNICLLKRSYLWRSEVSEHSSNQENSFLILIFFFFCGGGHCFSSRVACASMSHAGMACYRYCCPGHYDPLYI